MSPRTHGVARWKPLLLASVIVIALVVAPLFSAQAQAPAPRAPEDGAGPLAYPYPNGGTAVVDGNAGEWDLAADFFANMHRAGNPAFDVLSKLYLRYDCAASTLYLLVLAEPGAQIESFYTVSENWAKVNNQLKVSNLSGDDGVPPDFHYISSNGTYAAGWEASFVVTPGSYTNFNVHTQVFDGSAGAQTSAVANRSILLTLDCTRLGSIGDYIWWDDDRDKDEDYGVEQPLPGIRVRLLEKLPDGSFIDKGQTSTDDGGWYLFDNLPAGQYLVDVNEGDVPDDFVLTTDNEPYPWALSQGEHHRQADFGYDPDGGTVALGDWVWHDINANAMQDDGDGAAVGVRCITIWLKDGLGARIGQKNTDSWGNYYYLGLPPGSYATELDTGDEDLDQIQMGPKCHMVAEYVNLPTAAPRAFRPDAVFFTTPTTKSTSLPEPGMTDWTLDYGISTTPLSVFMASFTAQGGADRVTVAWETVSERGNAGFNLYRSGSAAGPLTLLAYVPSQAPGAGQGFAYGYEDRDVRSGQTYWYTLEDVSLSGATTLHGPVSATVQTPTAVTLSSVTASPAAAAGATLPWLLAAAGLAVAGGVALRRRLN